MLRLCKHVKFFVSISATFGRNFTSFWDSGWPRYHAWLGFEFEHENMDEDYEFHADLTGDSEGAMFDMDTCRFVYIVYRVYRGLSKKTWTVDSGQWTVDSDEWILHRLDTTCHFWQLSTAVNPKGSGKWTYDSYWIHLVHAFYFGLDLLICALLGLTGVGQGFH